ncbi:MAG: hypothetical protein ACFFCO_05055 [Promethearchaeota archaeon]
MISHLPYTITIILLLVLGVWTVRDTIIGYDELFDIFDPKIESELNLYTSMDRPATLGQHDFRQLFNDKTAYERYRNRLRGILFDRKELGLIALAILAMAFVATIVVLFLPHFWFFYGVTIYPLMLLVDFLWGFYWLVIFIFMLGVLHLFLGILRAISLLDQSKEDLRIWSYVSRLRGQQTRPNEALMSYEHFYDNASIIGRFIYGITFRIIIILIAWAVLVILMDLVNPLTGYTTSIFSWILSFSIILGGFLIFIFPQVGLHRFLTQTKDAVLNGLEQEQSQLQIEYIETLRKIRQQPRTLKHSDTEHEHRRRDIELLRQLILDTRESPTWSFRMPAALKILFTSLIPIFVIVIEMILRLYLFS